MVIASLCSSGHQEEARGGAAGPIGCLLCGVRGVPPSGDGRHLPGAHHRPTAALVGRVDGLWKKGCKHLGVA